MYDSKAVCHRYRNHPYSLSPHEHQSDVTRDVYGILLPKDYDSTKQYPYFIYVHGHGYGGDNTQGYNWSRFQTYLESLGFLDGEGVRDCIIIAPHLKVYQGEASWWSNAFNIIGWAPTDIPYDTTPPSDNLIDMYTLIRQVGDALNIDEKRVYITGASDGGYATWELITRFTDFFTAAIPLCGGADTTKAHILKASGALEYMRICKVTNLPTAIDELKEKGLWIYAADMDGDDYCSTDLKGAVAVVMGSEGFGISRLVKEKCDFTVSIPLHGKVNSMNVSCAAAVIFAEIARQRTKGAN